MRRQAGQQWVVGGGGPSGVVVAAAVGRIFYLFLVHFFPSVKSAHGKTFAMCPTSCTRQRSSLPTPVRRVPFVVCNTRQRLCRVLLAHGKHTGSRSQLT